MKYTVFVRLNKILFTYPGKDGEDQDRGEDGADVRTGSNNNNINSLS